MSPSSSTLLPSKYSQMPHWHLRIKSQLPGGLQRVKHWWDKAIVKEWRLWNGALTSEWGRALSSDERWREWLTSYPKKVAPTPIWVNRPALLGVGPWILFYWLVRVFRWVGKHVNAESTDNWRWSRRKRTSLECWLFMFGYISYLAAPSILSYEGHREKLNTLFVGREITFQ